MNLDRLKSSDLLMDGLDEFFATWLDPHLPHNLPIEFPSQYRAAIFQNLPPSIRQFYEVVQRWIWPVPWGYGPLAHKSNNTLALPYMAEQQDDEYDWQEVEDLAECLFQTHGKWSAAIKLYESSPALYIMNLDTDPSQWKRSSFDPEEFMIAIALEELINWVSRYIKPETPVPKSAELIFSGQTWESIIYVYYDREDNALWLANEASPSIALAKANTSWNIYNEMRAKSKSNSD